MAGRLKVFLTAAWRDLLMLNYAVDPSLLEHRVPKGTVLDSFSGKTYVSLVGFRFCGTKLYGSFPIPFHSNFEEVNLRFYVRREIGSERRRGVVFIAEIVPCLAVAQIARLAYGENYVCLPMKHSISSGETIKSATYEWRLNNEWCGMTARANSPPILPAENSLERFITEHYWGYSTSPGAASLEYRVEHPRWKVWICRDAFFEGNCTSLYGPELARAIRRPPDSAFIADGSSIAVLTGINIT